MANEDLQVYMSDHLAGARAGVELAEQLVRTSDDAGERQFFQELCDEIEADRQTLEGMLEGAGGHPSVIRQAGGWLSEKLIALKMRWDDPSGRGLTFFEALETLAIGVLGKRSLWRALAAVQPHVPQLQAFDLARLEARAQDQYDRIERKRIETGTRVFSEGGKAGR